ncbi:MAG: ABC transporter ATP-binding protein [Lachnospiraceae bacterium]|nr:ABC transporter ATP-binding protein [Lachnospiraceae bacterium]
MEAAVGKPVVLELKNVKKSFGDTEVLRGVNLTVHEGEFVTLLGSSGCGKTTTLRIIAGLEHPDSGEVILEGEVMGDRAPEKRNVNTVFQNYALFPHMNVYNNIAYGLKVHGVSKIEIRRRVTDMLALVQLEGFEKRMPSEMSGGQRQRVAIARALINNPKVLLLDEPLGALDLQLRRQMQLELKRLQKKLGITFIYITHDQEEAINMSDVIAVMRNGEFEQTGSPSEIYDTPKTSYVASFVGSANILRGRVLQVEDGAAVLENESGTMLCRTTKRAVDPEASSADENPEFLIRVGQERTMAVRIESIRVWRDKKSEYAIHGKILEKSFVGGMLRIEVKLDEISAKKENESDTVVISRHGINFHYDVGEMVYLEWDAQDAVFVDAEPDEAWENLDLQDEAGTGEEK